MLVMKTCQLLHQVAGKTKAEEGDLSGRGGAPTKRRRDEDARGRATKSRRDETAADGLPWQCEESDHAETPSVA